MNRIFHLVAAASSMFIGVNAFANAPDPTATVGSGGPAVPANR